MMHLFGKKHTGQKLGLENKKNKNEKIS